MISKLKKIFNFQRSEKIIFVILLFMILVSAIIKGDDTLAIFSGIFGLIYTCMLGKGKAIGYLFGIIGTVCGIIISYKINLFGAAALHLCYYFPMEILGFINWKKNTDTKTNEVIKTTISNNERIILFFLTFIIFGITYVLFENFNDSAPLLDSLITVFSLSGMYLSVKRAIDQWVIWTLVNILSVIMWFLVYLQGEKIFSILLVKIIYLILGIYFFFKWYFELKKDKTQK